jgi:hypothetical protein
VEQYLYSQRANRLFIRKKASKTNPRDALFAEKQKKHRETAAEISEDNMEQMAIELIQWLCFFTIYSMDRNNKFAKNIKRQKDVRRVNMREGLIPTLLGSSVLAAGTMIRGMDMERHGMHKSDMLPMIGAGLVGFGLAHIILGTKDLARK